MLLEVVLLENKDFKLLNSIPERVKLAMRGESQRVFAKRAGISEGTLRNVLSGGNPNIETLLRISNAAGMNLTILMGDNNDLSDADQEEAGYCHIPLYDVQASAGHGSYIDDEKVIDSLAFKKSWINANFSSPESLALISVTGDSMEPTLSDGDVVLVDLSDKQLDKDGVFAIQMDGNCYIKRLQLLPAGKLNVISDNTVFPPWELHLNDFLSQENHKIIGRVVWSGGQFA